MLRKDYVGWCAMLIGTALAAPLQADEPVFSAESERKLGVPDVSAPRYDQYTDAQRKTFCRDVVERAKPINRQLPVLVDGQAHICLRQIMAEYTRYGECRIIAQILIKQNEAVASMMREVYGAGGSESPGYEQKAAVARDWFVSGKGVGSLAVDISATLLQWPVFTRFSEVPFVRLELNTVLIGDEVQEFAFPMRVPQG